MYYGQFQCLFIEAWCEWHFLLKWIWAEEWYSSFINLSTPQRTYIPIQFPTNDSWPVPGGWGNASVKNTWIQSWGHDQDELVPPLEQQFFQPKQVGRQKLTTTVITGFESDNCNIEHQHSQQQCLTFNIDITIIILTTPPPFPIANPVSCRFCWKFNIIWSMVWSFLQPAQQQWH